jgi:transketolase
VEVTTGPLGQGFANGVGMAVAEAHLAARYNRPGFKLLDHFTYGLVSDGDLMEGVASETASLAGELKLGKLIYLYDDNRVTLSAATELTFTEDRAGRFSAYGWHTQSIEDGNDLGSIERALAAAREETKRPSLILVRTHIGYGSPQQDTFAAHGSPLGEEAVKRTKQKLGWPVEPPFLVPADASAHFREALDRGRQEHERWNDAFSAYERRYPRLAAELRGLIDQKPPPGWDADIPRFVADAKGLATRVASGKVMAALAAKHPGLIGGSADLDPSTHTALKDAGDLEDPAHADGDRQGSAGGGWSYAGRNLHFGVREHAMGAIANGLASHGGLLPFTATFLTFSDYMRPAMRLAALMGAQVVFVFTHDSIGLGEDGPTHQPIEHLAGLRAIPNLVVLRPGDANETAVAWRVAIETRDRPTALVLTRQKVPTLDRAVFAPAEGLRRGGYVLADPPSGRPRLILIASGSEVGLIAAAGKTLQERGIPVRLVSMPSWELFEAQDRRYRDSVLPSDIAAKLAVEAGATQGWHKYVGERGDVLGIDRFGASAPGEVVMREYGFSVENVRKRALALLDMRKEFGGHDEKKGSGR